MFVCMNVHGYLCGHVFVCVHECAWMLVWTCVCVFMSSPSSTTAVLRAVAADGAGNHRPRGGK